MCARLRESADGSESVEGAAQAIVAGIRAQLTRQGLEQSDVVLARAFLTQRVSDLPPDVQVDRDALPAQARVLALLASDGDEPAWCDRRASVAHQAISLANPESVAAAPMVSALVTELGVSPALLFGGPAPVPTHEDFDVFHVEQAVGSSRVPDQRFVAGHGVKSVVGFGGVLPNDEVFAVVLFFRVQVPSGAASLFKTVAVTTKLALLPTLDGPVYLGQQPRAQLRDLIPAARTAALEQLLTVEERALREQDEALRREGEIVEKLHTVGEALTAELELERVVLRATEACVEVTGAQFGAFFYNVVDANGESYMLYTIAGVPPEHFTQFPMPRNTPVFAPTFAGEGVVRSPDITKDPRFGKMPPYHGMPPGHLPVRSYLATPVVSTTGEVHGGLFFGHEDVDVFDARAERLATGIASQTAVALDNARLFRHQRDTAIELQRALLPRALPEVAGLSTCHRYVPGTAGVEVGGDWYDAIPRSDGRVMVVIGDVMGRGTRAAAAMGQLRTATRALNVAGLPPGEVMRHLNRLAGEIEEERIATCLIVLLDPRDGSATLANAGHLSPLLTDGVDAHVLPVPAGTPLGVVDDARYAEVVHVVPKGSSLLLFTDGLVEDKARSVDDGIRDLIDLLSGRDFDDDLCDKIVDAMVGGRQEADDVALIAISRPLEAAQLVEPAR